MRRERTNEERIRRLERTKAWLWIATVLGIFWAVAAWLITDWLGAELEDRLIAGMVMYVVAWFIGLVVGGMCCSVPDGEDDHVAD